MIEIGPAEFKGNFFCRQNDQKFPEEPDNRNNRNALPPSGSLQIGRAAGYGHRSNTAMAKGKRRAGPGLRVAHALGRQQLRR